MVGGNLVGFLLKNKVHINQKRSFYIIMVGPSARTRRITVFINIGILELINLSKTLTDYSFSSKVQYQATLKSIPERQYVHF